ncbi:response regulator [Candidatus Woesearchaeota archaeon]|nr:response regulator [Candidatus Woesearchaeota archaeon]
MSKILVVDDSEYAANAVKLILEHEGISVIHTDKGNEVLDIVKKEGVELVILDLMMPDVDGHTVFMYLKQDPMTKHIPIIILTARADAIRWHDEIQGCDLFMKKPFENRELVEGVKKLLASRKK